MTATVTLEKVIAGREVGSFIIESGCLLMCYAGNGLTKGQGGESESLGRERIIYPGRWG